MARSEGKPQGMRMGAVEPAAMDNGGALPHTSGLPAAGMVRTHTAYQQAIVVQKPRSIKRLTDAVLEEAAMSGETFIYTYRVKDKHSKDADGKSAIEGVSIVGAQILLRNWTNASCPIQVVEDTATHWMFLATFVDIETGTQMERLYRQRKSESHGNFDNERALDIAFQIGQSKAIRNAVCHALPQWLQDRAMNAAKDAAAAQYKDPKAFAYALAQARKYAAEALKIKDADAKLQAKVGKSFEDWLPRDIVFIRSVFRAIADKLTTVSSEFEYDAAPAGTEPEAAATADGATPAATTTPAAPAVTTADNTPPPAAATPADGPKQPVVTPAEERDPVTGERVPTEAEIAATRTEGKPNG